jgi:hypothetical protein
MSSEPPRPGAVPEPGGQPAQPEPGGQPAPAPAPGVPSAPPTTAPGAVPGWGQTPTPPPGTPASPPPSTQPMPPSAPPPTQPGAWATPPGAPQAAPGGTPPGAWNPQPLPPSGNSGCLRACLIVAAILIALVVLGGIAFVLLVNQAVRDTGITENSAGKPCTIISDADLSSVMGSQAQALELTGLYDISIGFVLDKRVLPDAYDCWITADGSNAIGRIARYDGGDAASVFQQERQNAAPTSQDQGNGVSIENSGYFAGDVSGLYDEAFCTGITLAGQAGVLVRKGNTLVYVSLSSSDLGTPPDIGATESGVLTAPSICAQAQDVARAILK